MGDGSGMSNDRSNNFPPVGSPDRYDMIVQRGRALRRRRRYTLGAGAGGTVVALAVAVVLITNGGSDDANATEFADDGTTTTEAIVETTTSVPMPAAMTVTIDPDTSTILVQDPAQPVHADAKQCVYLRLTQPDGAFVAEGNTCNSTPGPVEVPINPPGVEIGMACQTPRYEQSELQTEDTGPASSTFVYELDPSLTGSYAVTVSAVSGLTDGCADTVDPTVERENQAEHTTTIELP